MIEVAVLPYVAIALVAACITQVTKKLVKRYVQNPALSLILDGRVLPMVLGLCLGWALISLLGPFGWLYGAASGIASSWVWGTVRRTVEGFKPIK